MHEKWRIGGGGDEDDADNKDDPNEATLTTVSGTFNGVCYKYRKRGCKASDFPKNKVEDHKNRGFCRTCNYCGKVGHKERDYWDKPENAHKRSAGYKPKTEGRAGQIEILVANMEVEDKEEKRMTAQDGSSISTTMTAQDGSSMGRDKLKKRITAQNGSSIHKNMTAQDGSSMWTMVGMTA